jgi:hypothetical protein
MSVEFDLDGEKISKFLSLADFDFLANQLGGIKNGEFVFGDPLTVVGNPEGRVLTLSNSFVAAGFPMYRWPYGEAQPLDRPLLQEGSARFDDLVYLEVGLIN